MSPITTLEPPPSSLRSTGFVQARATALAPLTELGWNEEMWAAPTGTGIELVKKTSVVLNMMWSIASVFASPMPSNGPGP